MGNTPPNSSVLEEGDEGSVVTVKQQQQQQQQQDDNNNTSNILSSPRITQLRDRKRLIENEIIESKVWSNIPMMNIHDDDDDDGDDDVNENTGEPSSAAPPPSTTRRSAPSQAPPSSSSSSSSSPPSSPQTTNSKTSRSIKSYEFVSDDDIRRIENDTKEKHRQKKKKKQVYHHSSNDTPETEATTITATDNNDDDPELLISPSPSPSSSSSSSLDTIYQTFLKDAQHALIVEEEGGGGGAASSSHESYDFLVVNNNNNTSRSQNASSNPSSNNKKKKKHKRSTTTTTTTDNYRCFVVVLHEDYGMLLLHYTKHPTKDPHYQLPGGNIMESDFYSDEFIKSVTTTITTTTTTKEKGAGSGSSGGLSWPKQLYLAARIACSRLLKDQTGLNFDSNKLLPLIVQKQQQQQQQSSVDGTDDDTSGSILLRNEYKQRLFFILQIQDDDFYKQETYSAARNSGDCPLARLKLSEKHSGFRFESDPKRSAAFLKHFSGGRVTKTIWEMIKRAEKEEEEEEERTAANHHESANTSSSSNVPAAAIPSPLASHDDDHDQRSRIDDDTSGRKSDVNSLDATASSQVSLNTFLTNDKTKNHVSSIDESNRISLDSFFGNRQQKQETDEIDAAAAEDPGSGGYYGNIINNDDALTVVTTGYERLLEDAKQNVDWSFLQQYTGPFGPDIPFEEEPEDENQPPPPPPQPLEEPGKIYYGGYVFVLHDQHGMMMLQRKGKLRQPPHYQIPGGRVDEIDFQQYKYGSWVAQCYLACRAACVRELRDATGLQIRSQRLQPITFSSKPERDETSNRVGDSSSTHIREDQDGEMLLMNEYEERLFYVLTVTDEDFKRDEANQNDDRVSSKAQNDDCSLVLKLSPTYKGFCFEKNSLRSIELLENQGGGKIFEALWMALQQQQQDTQQPLR